MELRFTKFSICAIVDVTRCDSFVNNLENHMHRNVNCHFKGSRRVTIYCEIVSLLNCGVKMAFQSFTWVTVYGGEREVIS